MPPTKTAPFKTSTQVWVLTLLFLATTINYLDRIVFSVLIPIIRGEMHLNDKDYGYLTGAFQFAYTVGFLIAGKFVDRFGVKIGYAVAIVWWSVAAGLHALSRGALDLGFWRAMLGFGEAGNFPAAIKSVAEWFPKKDRAFATGVFNAGTNVASMIGPPAFVWLNLRYGWRACFLLTAALGLVWVVFWMSSYRQPPVIVVPGEAEERRMGWLEALRYPQAWGFAVAKFLTDPVWWFYLYWLPPYLYDVRKFDLQQIGWALPVVYIMADVGSVGGGWISGWLIRRGWEVGRARKATMILCAACMPVAAMAVFAPGPVLAIALVSLATAAHQGWSANLFTTTSDAFPKAAVASVTGIGGCAGGGGGFLFSAVIPGFVVTHFGYTPMFVFMGTLHLAAWMVMRRLVWNPRRDPSLA
ncbi:MAG: MFS transporter [Acidobacteria bacterium]|nr:MFS transporter [Acidobacteriota bacterium]